MQACKCDRCGKFYEPVVDYPRFTISYDTEDYDGEYLDICPECQKFFKEQFKDYLKNKDKEEHSF